MSHYHRSKAQGGTYFFTLSLADRRSRLLVDEIERLRRSYRIVGDKRPFETVAICVLPDHLHAIWQLPDDDADFSTRWSLFKRNFSTGLNAVPNSSGSKTLRREKGIWQRRFWEHQIRDDLDLQRHVDYVHYNPVKHGLVARVQDWPYSSVHRYVKSGQLNSDWGGSRASDVGEYGER